jgi:predicted TIM-barrel fold metal-dependent hydrolase
MFIFDNAVHAYDNTSTNVFDANKEEADYFTIGPGSVGKMIAELPALDATGRLWSDPDFARKRLGIDEALKLLFQDSETDMAMAQTVPISDFWKDFVYPLQMQYELKEAAPDRIVFVGAVDPNTMSPAECVREVERQVRDLGATSIKFYQASAFDKWWSADDREVVYPIFEKCLELGVRCVQFHKGFAFSQQLMSPAMRSLDLQRPARDFPELQFIVHHMGWPYEDETIQVVSRFPNISLSMAALIQFYAIAPKMAQHILGKALLWLGPQRVLYGSEGFVWPNFQSIIELFDEMEMPEQLQEDYGYPAITREMKELMYGGNLARIMGIDIEAKKAELAANNGSVVSR